MIPVLKFQKSVTSMAGNPDSTRRVGEVWNEIRDELKVENVRPVTPDEEAMETISRASAERAKGVAVLQSELLDAENQQNAQEEKQLLAEIKENFKQRENSIKRWSDYVKRTSDHNYLQMCKKKQDKSIESSRIKPRYRDERFAGTTKHSTKIENLNTTTFQGRNISIDTSPRAAVRSDGHGVSPSNMTKESAIAQMVQDFC